MSHRLVIFTDPRDTAARILLPHLLDRIAERPQWTCVAVVTSAPDEAGRGAWRRPAELARRNLQIALGSGRRERALAVPPLSLSRLAKRHGFAILAAPEGNPNNQGLLQHLRESLAANLAFNIYCKSLFRAPLLDSFAMTVNYHNGELPRYRGLRASNWSIYDEQPHSSFTFHCMDSGMDTGNILCSEAVPIVADDTPGDLELRKAEKARDSLPLVLDAMQRRDFGHRQQGIGCEHTRPAYLLATCIEDPGALSHAEWNRRLRAFLRIRTLIDGKWYPVTRLALASGPGQFTFRSADGYWLKISALDFWPTWMRAVTGPFQ